MFNLRVEIPSRFHKFENQKCLRPLLREDDRENHSAHSWLVHVFTQPGSKPEKLNASICFPLCPRKRTQVGHPAMSESCQKRTMEQLQHLDQDPCNVSSRGIRLIRRA